MKVRVLLAVAVLLCIGCSDSQIHQVKLANADLASALNRATQTVINLTQQGSLTPAEQREILPRISDASLLSDKVTSCTTAVNAANTLEGCVKPLLTTIRDDISAASLGVKSDGAKATLNVIFTGLIENVGQIGGVR